LGKAVAIHSHKGGSGKTLIATNLASLLARSGKNTCLLDYDFRAPSQHVMFKHKPELWLNDFLDGKCEIGDVIVDFSGKLQTGGKFFVGFANWNSDAILDMMTKDRGWQSKALARIMEAKEELYKNLGVEYLFFDTSPGIHFSSVDAVASSDLAILVMRPDHLDSEGTKTLIRAIYRVLEKKTFILVNKYVSKLICSDPEASILPLDEKSIAQKLHLDLPMIGAIPCYCDLMLTGGETIHAIDNPHHPFVDKLRLIADKIEQQ